MRPLIQQIQTAHTPESLVERLHGARGIVLLRSASFDAISGRYSFVAANPFLTFKSWGSQCEFTQHATRNTRTQFGNPWHLLDGLMSRYELLDEVDLPFPLGGCFGYWGYELKNFTEPKLSRRAANDLELPDCHVGFYDSLVVFDHQLGKVCVISTGLNADGSRTDARLIAGLQFWQGMLSLADEAKDHALPLPSPRQTGTTVRAANVSCGATNSWRAWEATGIEGEGSNYSSCTSNLSKQTFLTAVQRAQQYIRAGDIYQVNLSQRLTAAWASSGWDLFQRLAAMSPAPFSAYFDCGDFQVASSSPEQFLRMSGSHIVTRPIKGTRPRDNDPTRDAQLAYELQTSAKELAELVMITDLLRNDLGKVCEYGSVQVPELAKLEKFAQVQHLISTVEGRLRKDTSHFAALASTFPGGSITGAPKFRAMEIIDELESIARGPYCGCHGYLGFNRESQLSITIRTAVCKDGAAHFNVGAGIVADSVPEAEYEETLAKAAGFRAVLKLELPISLSPQPISPLAYWSEPVRGQVGPGPG